jgi:hypothetical protein
MKAKRAASLVGSIAPLLLVVATSGCTKSASGPLFAHQAPPSGKGVVYVYRPSSMSGGARSIYLSVPYEANNCYELDNGGYLAYVTEPGTVTIGASVSGEMQKLPLQVGAGQERFVRAEFASSFGGGTSELTEVPANEGAAEIRDMRAITACER